MLGAVPSAASASTAATLSRSMRVTPASISSPATVVQSATGASSACSSAPLRTDAPLYGTFASAGILRVVVGHNGKSIYVGTFDSLRVGGCGCTRETQRAVHRELPRPGVGYLIEDAPAGAHSSYRIEAAISGDYPRPGSPAT